MKTQQPITSEEEHRVLKFRPRTLAHPPGRRADPAEPEDARPDANDLSRYERDRNEPDDFRHRMLANIAAFAFTVALTAIGICWFTPIVWYPSPSLYPVTRSWRGWRYDLEVRIATSVIKLLIAA